MDKIEFLIFFRSTVLAKIILSYDPNNLPPLRSTIATLNLWFINNPPQEQMWDLLYYLTTTPFGKQALDITKLSQTSKEPELASYSAVVFILNQLPPGWHFTQSDAINAPEGLESSDLYENFGVCIY